MSIIVIFDEGDRSFIRRLIDKARPGTRVQIMPAKHTDEQGRKLQVLLSEVANQKIHGGRYYTEDQWKALFLHACGTEHEFLPSLDGESMIPYGGKSSHMGIADMSALIEFILIWGTQNGVEFRE